MSNSPEVEDALDEIRQQLALMPLEEFTDHFIGGMHWIYAATDVAEQDRRRQALAEFLQQRGAVLDQVLEKLAQARAKYAPPSDSA